MPRKIRYNRSMQAAFIAPTPTESRDAGDVIRQLSNRNATLKLLFTIYQRGPSRVSNADGKFSPRKAAHCLGISVKHLLSCIDHARKDLLHGSDDTRGD
jgi:hypothetical protein